MYSGIWKPAFQPDESKWKYAREREAYVRQLQESGSALSPPLPKEEIMPPAVPPPKKRPPKVDLSQLLEQISPEDSALISLIVFLLCDNTENDVVLLGILLYVLLSK